MRKIVFVVSYDGTNYSGWQRQENALGIQEVVEDVLKEVTGEDITVKCAGRTDAGVHAEGQVIDFLTNSTIPADRFIYPMNNFLPEDIRILRSVEVDNDFSARFSCIYKHYRYTIDTSSIILPKITRYVAKYDRKLDFDIMKKGAKLMEGEHDFKAFEGPYAQMNSSIRRVLKVDIKKEDNFIYIDVFGEAFLKNMVRIMVGTLIKMGEGRLKEEELLELFEKPDRKKAGITMPASGLSMIRVYYEDEIMKLLFE